MCQFCFKYRVYFKKHKNLSSSKEETIALEDFRTVQNGFLLLRKIIFQSLPGKEPKEENLQNQVFSRSMCVLINSGSNCMDLFSLFIVVTTSGWEV